MDEQEKSYLLEVISNFSNEVPMDIDLNWLNENIKDIIKLLHVKGLSVWQAQLILKICSEYIIYCTSI